MNKMTPEIMKAMLDDIPQNYIDELNNADISLDELNSFNEQPQNEEWSTCDNIMLVQNTKPRRKIAVISAFAGTAAVFAIVLGIGMHINRNKPDTDTPAPNLFESTTLSSDIQQNDPHTTENVSENITVPDFTFLNCDEAVDTAKFLGLDIEKKYVESSEKAGIITRQSPTAGTKIKSGETLTLYISSGSEDTSPTAKTTSDEEIIETKSVKPSYRTTNAVQAENSTASDKTTAEANTKTTAKTTASPKHTTKVTTDSSGSDGKNTHYHSLENTKKIIAESNTFWEMLEKEEAISHFSREYGSGISHIEYDIDFYKGEKIVYTSQEEIIYYNSKNSIGEMLYQGRTYDNTTEALNNRRLEEYLVSLGYSASDIEIMKNSRVKISDKESALAVASLNFIGYENHYYDDEIFFEYNTDTTELIDKAAGLGTLSYLDVFAPPVLNDEIKDEHTDGRYRGGRLCYNVDFTNGMCQNEENSLVNLVFRTSDKNDIQFDSKYGYPSHVLYFGDVCIDEYWDYNDIMQYFLDLKEYSQFSVLSAEIAVIIHIDDTPTQLMQPQLSQPKEVFRRLCDIVLGTEDNFE
ncbi:MAG: PASTA domain-containing protein [Ruminococcus sp.]|nr:PASTA domain-containing protein [Ruminococcus sp.]